MIYELKMGNNKFAQVLATLECEDIIPPVDALRMMIICTGLTNENSVTIEGEGFRFTRHAGASDQSREADGASP